MTSLYIVNGWAARREAVQSRQDSEDRQAGGHAVKQTDRQLLNGFHHFTWLLSLHLWENTDYEHAASEAAAATAAAATSYA